MKNITVVIHTYNEAHNITACIESARKLTKHVLVVDMESTDGTIEKTQQMGIEPITFPFSHYVEPARAFGIQQAQTDWVLIIDADERLTDSLITELSELLQKKNNTETHFKIPRKNIFGTVKWLKNGGWWPDHQMRLINKTYFKTWPSRIHSTPDIEGRMGYLNNPILHYFHGNLEKMVEKTIIFENIESDLLYKAGRTVSTSTFFRKFFGELFRRFFKKKGFKDGHIGIIESIYQAFSKTITYIYLYEKKKSSTV